MNQPLPYDAAVFSARARALIANTRELAALGWTPATSSNIFCTL